MTNTRSPLQDMNKRRINNAPIDELHKTLETLEQRLKEMVDEQKTLAAQKTGATTSSKPHISLAEIAATLDSQMSSATGKPAPHKFAAPLPKAELHIDEELARIESSVDILTAQNAEQNNDNDTLRHIRETAEHLQDELETLKRMMQTMAREESLRRLHHRWDQFDEKFEVFEQSQSQKTETEFPELNSISDRLDDVRRTIDAMPQMQAVSIQPLGDRINDLAQLIEQMVNQKDEYTVPPVLNERLDKISSAIIAGNMKRPDTEETRHAQALSQELLTRIAELSQRIDFLSENSSLPLQQIETLAKQIRLIATYIDRALESGPALELEKVNIRLDDIANQLSNIETGFSVPEDVIFTALDQRFDALVTRLDEQFSQPSPDNNMLQNLEAQIAAIAQQLTEPLDQHQLVKNLEPRLQDIENAALHNREDTLDIARTAAETAMEKFAAQAHQYQSDIVKELANDMRALEELARGNEKNFDSVHKTLLKVVERLTALEEHHKPSTATVAKAEIKPVTAPARPLMSAIKAPPSASADLSNVSAAPQQQASEKPAELPDINAIMKRVRGEPGLRSNLSPEKDRQANFITAARSAAQAATLESERINADEKSCKTAQNAPKKSSFTQLIARQRKPIFLSIGAIMVALAALQAGEIYFNKSLVAPPQLAKTQTSIEELITHSTETNTEAPEQMPVTEAIKPDAVTKSEAAQASDLTSESTETKAETSASAIKATPEAVTDIETAASQTALPALPQISAEAGPLPLRQAAEEGNALALFEIGNRYTDGIGTQADLTKAAAFYAAAAARDFAPAQYHLGSLNEKGLGLPRNLAEARHWYIKSAEQGNASAMHNLAVLYATGSDGAPDNKAAIDWFEKAAERDVKDSQYNLGILYAQGVGTDTDLEESYKWFALAAQSGDQDAADKRDQVAKALSADKLKQAQAKVALWKPKTLDHAANSTTIPDSWTDENPVQTASVDMTKAVRNIQLILQKNGYDIGTADGLMGDKTRNAIKKFQTDNGEAPTGEVNPQLVKLLLDHNK